MLTAILLSCSGGYVDEEGNCIQTVPLLIKPDNQSFLLLYTLLLLK